MILGSRAIILDVEEAKKLLDAVRIAWDKERIELLIGRGLMDTVNSLDSAIREIESVENARNYFA